MLASGIDPSDIYDAMTMLYKQQRKVSGSLKQPLIYFRLVDVQTACLRYVDPDDLAPVEPFLSYYQRIRRANIKTVRESTLSDS